jgi:hypothetical protein
MTAILIISGMLLLAVLAPRFGTDTDRRDSTHRLF